MHKEQKWLQKYYEFYDQPDYEKRLDLRYSVSSIGKVDNDPQLSWICENIKRRNCKIIHDFGCGIGRLLWGLNNRSITKQHGFFYFGIDVDQKVLVKAVAVAKKLKMEQKCRFMTPKEWENQSELSTKASVVVMNDVIHHMNHEQISNLLSILSSSVAPNIPLIIGEVALFKRVEPHRVPLSNSDWDFLCQKLGLLVETQPDFSPKGLPLVRVILNVPENRYGKMNTFEIDTALRETFENKLRNLNISLELWNKQVSTEKARVGMLEVQHHVSQLLAHWIDQGKFIQIESKLKPRLIKRKKILNSLRSVVNKETIVVIEGDYGVGKTTLLQTFLRCFTKPFLAATATFSSDEITMSSWFFKEAKEKKYKDLINVYQDFSKTPDMLFEDIIKSIAKRQILLVIDNSHLLAKGFLHRLQKTCLKYKCKLLLISSQTVECFKETKGLQKLSVTGFTQKQNCEWLKKNVNEYYSKKQASEIWKECDNGNPQKLEIRFKANIEYSIPNSFGKISKTDFAAVCASMLQAEGLRVNELTQVAKCDIKIIESFIERSILQKRGDFLAPHDIVAGMIVGSQEFDTITNRLRNSFCHLLSNKYLPTKIRDSRLSQNQWEDVLRLCNQLRLQGKYKQAWKILEAVSYAVYMDGDYDKLLREIEILRKASPGTYKPETNYALFWLWLRKGRILKKRGFLQEAKQLFSLLLQNTCGRRQLAVLKELAEIARLEGNVDLSVDLFKRAKNLDNRWAKNKRDKMITLKQLGITLCEKGNFAIATDLIEKSLKGRKRNDAYGIASCLRYLSYVKLCYINSKTRLSKDRKLALLSEAWQNALSALEGFHHLNDAEGRSGATHLICEIGYHAIIIEKLDHWKTPLKHVLKQYYPLCFKEHKLEIRKLCKRRSKIVPPGGRLKSVPL